MNQSTRKKEVREEDIDLRKDNAYNSIPSRHDQQIFSFPYGEEQSIPQRSLNDLSNKIGEIDPTCYWTLNRRETEEEHMDQSRFKLAPAILFTFPFPRGSFVPPSGAKGDVGRETGGGWRPPRGWKVR